MRVGGGYRSIKGSFHATQFYVAWGALKFDYCQPLWFAATLAPATRGAPWAVAALAATVRAHAQPLRRLRELRRLCELRRLFGGRLRLQSNSKRPQANKSHKRVLQRTRN